MFKVCPPPLHAFKPEIFSEMKGYSSIRDYCLREPYLSKIRHPTNIPFTKEIKREWKYIAKPDLESMLVAVGWAGDGANAPGCVNPMGKCWHMAALTQWESASCPLLTMSCLWDSPGAETGPSCALLGGELIPSTLHHCGPPVPWSVKLCSVGRLYFPPPSVHEDHSNVFRALPTSS